MAFIPPVMIIQFFDMTHLLGLESVLSFHILAQSERVGPR